MPRVFFVSGTTAGIGKELVQHIINSGDYVIAAARRVEALSFENTTPKNYLPVYIELTDAETVQKAFNSGVEKFGRIDVVVNNGGYGLSGAFEDLSDADIKKQFDVNFIGTLVATRIAMKIMREQSPPGGVIQNVSSVLGRVAMPWMSMYNASKFAVEGLTESLVLEVKPEWNIKFNLAEFGGFKTDFFSRSMTYTHPESSAYDLAYIKDFLHKQMLANTNDAKKGAKAMYEVATRDEVPAKSVFGSDAFEWLDGHYKDLHANLLKDEKLSRSCDADAKENGANGH